MNPSNRRDIIFAEDEALFHGQPLAAVLAGRFLWRDLGTSISRQFRTSSGLIRAYSGARARGSIPPSVKRIRSQKQTRR